MNMDWVHTRFVTLAVIAALCFWLGFAFMARGEPAPMNTLMCDQPEQAETVLFQVSNGTEADEAVAKVNEIAKGSACAVLPALIEPGERVSTKSYRNFGRMWSVCEGTVFAVMSGAGPIRVDPPATQYYACVVQDTEARS